MKLIEPTIGCTYDYQPMKGPRELASNAELVIQGTIGNPRPGFRRVRPDGSQGPVQTDIIPIEADSVLVVGPHRKKAALRKYRHTAVFNIETGCAIAKPGRRTKLASLAGRKALVYVVRAQKSLSGRWFGPGSYGSAGRPEPLFTTSSVEGFLMELASGDGIRNLDLNERFPDVGFRQFLPDERRFPPRR